MEQFVDRRKYLGNALSYEGVFMIHGKWTDDSMPDDWWLYKNGSTSASNKVSLVDYTNPITKEFKYISNVLPTKLTNLFKNNTALQHIYDMTGLEECNAFSSVFYNCLSLETIHISNFDISKSTGSAWGSFMSPNLTSITFDKGKIASLGAMFAGASSLLEMDLSMIDLSECISIYEAFVNCNKVRSINFGDNHLNKIVQFRNAFQNCSSLEELHINVDFQNCSETSAATTFNSRVLTTITGSMSNIKFELDVTSCPLTYESAMVILNGLIEPDEVRGICINGTIYNMLSEEQKRIITSKGWNIFKDWKLADEAYS